MQPLRAWVVLRGHDKRVARDRRGLLSQTVAQSAYWAGSNRVQAILPLGCLGSGNVGFLFGGAATVMLCPVFRREALRFEAHKPAYPLASRER